MGGHRRWHDVRFGRRMVYVRAMRSLRFLLPSLVFLASVPALAQGAPVEPLPAPTTTAPPVTTTAPPPQTPPPPVAGDPGSPVAVASSTGCVDDEEQARRFGRMLSEAASVDKRARLIGGAVNLVQDGLVIATNAVLLTFNNTSDSWKALAGVSIATAGIDAGFTIISMIRPSGFESFDDEYQVLLADRSVPGAAKVAAGENALRRYADSARANRIRTGISTIVTGVVLGVIAVPIALDYPTLPGRESEKAYIGLVYGTMAFSYLANGIATIAWRETAAEHMWRAWSAGHGLSGVRMTPFVTAIPGGAVGGIGATF